MKSKNKLTRDKVLPIAASALAIAVSGLAPAKAFAFRRSTQTEASAKSRGKLPKAVLTGLVEKLEQGGSVEVAVHDKLPGAKGFAQGRPIVFKARGHDYLAYTQVHSPDFDQKRPADVVADMAIIREPHADQNIPVTQAHLDKNGLLVNEDQMANVGYSRGGDTSSK